MFSLETDFYGAPTLLVCKSLIFLCLFNKCRGYRVGKSEVDSSFSFHLCHLQFGFLWLISWMNFFFLLICLTRENIKFDATIIIKFQKTIKNYSMNNVPVHANGHAFYEKIIYCFPS